MLDLVANSPVIRMVVSAILFAVVAGSVALILIGRTRRLEVLNELQEIAASSQRGESQESLRQSANASAWARLVERVESTGLHLTDSKHNELRKKLILAGYDSPLAPKVFTLLKLVLTLALPGFFLMLTLAGGQQFSVLKLYVYATILALVGLYLPNLYITAKADRRREAIVHGFPDALDLLLICVEAGLGLEAALDKVGREMARSHPLIAKLLINSTLQMRAGASREAALHSLGEDAAVDEVRSFATLLIQSDKLGTSIATTLRIYAAEMREKRRLRAEEKAHRLPVLISIPLVTCMLPVTIGILMLPAAIRVVRQLLPTLGG